MRCDAECIAKIDRRGFVGANFIFALYSGNRQWNDIKLTVISVHPRNWFYHSHASCVNTSLLLFSFVPSTSSVANQKLLDSSSKSECFHIWDNHHVMTKFLLLSTFIIAKKEENGANFESANCVSYSLIAPCWYFPVSFLHNESIFFLKKLNEAPLQSLLDL